MSAANELWGAQDDLTRLSGLLRDAFGELLNCFIAVQAAARTAGSLAEMDRVTGRAISALQCQDLASQLIGFTQQRLSRASEALKSTPEISHTPMTVPVWLAGTSAGGESVSVPPVQQDAMRAGTIEFF